MDEVSRIRINQLGGASLALLGASRLVSYWRSGEPIDAMWGVGMLCLGFSVHRSRLISSPFEKATSTIDRLAGICGYIGLSLLFWAVVKLLLS